MGTPLSTYSSPQRLFSNVKEYVSGRKRKFSDSDSQEEINKIIDIAMHTPKRKKLSSTPEYIYQALFLEGKNSDVTVRALGEELQLHKVYLCQSPYFSSMFGGSWLETAKNFISIDIVDPQITVDSFKIVLGSLYNDEVVLHPMKIVSILATATMLQVDGIIDKCSEVMIETLNPKTALSYYNASCQYGESRIRNASMNWFLINLMTYCFVQPLTTLRFITMDLMTKLISNPDLFVMQTEFSIYVMLKYWMYIHLHPNLTEEPCTQDINMFYCSRKDQTAFLLTPDGEKFVSTFQALRIHNLITHHMDVEMIQCDNIIPRSCINPVVINQWKVMLKVNQNEEKGPNECLEKIFLENSLRCGRILTEKERHVWRWTGFHYGVDLLMIADGASLSIKRNHRAEYEQLLSFQTIRHIAVRVTVVTLDEQRQVKYKQTTGIKNLTLAKGEEVPLLTFEQNINFPLIISTNILVTSAESQDTTQHEVVQTIS